MCGAVSEQKELEPDSCQAGSTLAMGPRPQQLARRRSRFHTHTSTPAQPRQSRQPLKRLFLTFLARSCWSAKCEAPQPVRPSGQESAAKPIAAIGDSTYARPVHACIGSIATFLREIPHNTTEEWLKRKNILKTPPRAHVLSPLTMPRLARQGAPCHGAFQRQQMHRGERRIR